MLSIFLLLVLVLVLLSLVADMVAPLMLLFFGISSLAQQFAHIYWLVACAHFGGGVSVCKFTCEPPQFAPRCIHIETKSNCAHIEIYKHFFVICFVEFQQALVSFCTLIYRLLSWMKPLALEAVSWSNSPEFWRVCMCYVYAQAGKHTCIM